LYICILWYRHSLQFSDITSKLRFFIAHRNRNKIVDVTTRLWAESNVKSWFGVRQRKGTFPPKRPGWFWIQPTLLFSDGRGSFPRDKAPGVEAGHSPPPLGPRLKMCNYAFASQHPCKAYRGETSAHKKDKVTKNINLIN